MEPQSPSIDDVLPLLEAVDRNAAAPEQALRDLYRAWWDSIYFRVPTFEGPWEILSDMMDALELYEPNPTRRAQSSAFFGSEEAVRLVRDVLVGLAHPTAPQPAAGVTGPAVNAATGEDVPPL
jgi:hypothetical protein